MEQSYRWGRAYRDGQLVAARVYVTILRDVRIAPSPPVPRQLRVRFVQGVDATLRDELERLVLIRGSRARRLAARFAPVKVVWEEPPGLRADGRRSCVGRLEPEARRHAPLDEIDFRLHPVDQP